MATDFCQPQWHISNEHNRLLEGFKLEEFKTGLAG